jgi:hypothetical protein
MPVNAQIASELTDSVQTTAVIRTAEVARYAGHADILAEQILSSGR